MSDKRQVHIHVPVLTRVEGEGALTLTLDNGEIEQLKLEIFEPPRYFEKFLEGRQPQEVIDAVARICGICPIAYQISAVQAIEQAFNISTTPWTKAMRRVFYCGEWIQSHALHIHLLAAPDFLGFDTAIQMAGKYPDEVRRGLGLQSIGNDLIKLFGARSVHPVGVRPGGFFRIPKQNEIKDVLTRLREALPLAEKLVKWTSSLPFPEVQQPFTSVALHHPDEYAINQGRIISSKGLDIDIAEYEHYFTETHKAHSTALYSHLQGEPYLVGPLARINLNYEQLPEEVRHTAESTGISFPSQNMFHSIVARAVEIHFAIYEAIRLLDTKHPPLQTDNNFTPVATSGFGCSEAPRGILWHKYKFDDSGSVESAKIVPPTSQNQARIEEDLRASLTAKGLDQAEAVLRQHSEMVIRNYDPCISCATHFIKLEIQHV